MSSSDLIPSDIERGAALHQRLLQLSSFAYHSFFEMGTIMKEIRDNRLWQSLGFDSFESYFSDPELAYPKSSVYHAIALVESFPNWREMEPVPVSKLIMIAPHVNEENKPKLLEYAKGLSKSDLKFQLEEMKLPTSNPAYFDLPKIYRCSFCRGLKGAFFDDLCHCGWTPEQLKKVSGIIKEVNSL